MLTFCKYRFVRTVVRFATYDCFANVCFTICRICAVVLVGSSRLMKSYVVHDGSDRPNTYRKHPGAYFFRNQQSKANINTGFGVCGGEFVVIEGGALGYRAGVYGV